jgi:hypothetical protein
VSGVVHNEDGPVTGAIVRVRNTDFQTTSGADGSFTLADLPMSEPISVTAWLEGHYIGATNAMPGSAPVSITLRDYPTIDNLDYEFASAEKCAECHVNFAEWQVDAHGQAAVNPRFVTMYEGTDVQGNKSPPSYGATGLPEPPWRQKTRVGGWAATPISPHRCLIRCRTEYILRTSRGSPLRA